MKHRVQDFRISIWPITWILWPIWSKGYELHAINLGPLRIEWRVYEVFDE